MTEQPSDAPRICVAIPFFSNLGYLDAALRSLIAQTDRQWSAVVIDDASPQLGAAEVVASIGDRRIAFERNAQNLGVAKNFNRCLEVGAAEAEIVVVFHADDELERGYIAAVRAAHRTYPAAACVAPRVTVIDGRGSPTRTLGDAVKHALWPRKLPATLVGDAGLAQVMRGLFFYCPSVSYRVALLPELRFDDRWQQVMDLDLYTRTLLDGGLIVVIPDRVYRYRRHSGTMTAQNSRSLVRLSEEVTVSREVAGAARELGWNRAARAARIRVTVRLNGLLESTRLVVGREFRAAASAARQALAP